MAKYKLKEGIELNPFGEGSVINNDNLTDAIAEFLINERGVDIENFDVELSESDKAEADAKAADKAEQEAKDKAEADAKEKESKKGNPKADK